MTVEPESEYWNKPSYRIMAEQLEDLLGKQKQLQAIAGTPRCEHGKIDEHLAQRQMHDSFGVKNRPHEYMCIGAPELRFLLDVLEVEEK